MALLWTKTAMKSTQQLCLLYLRKLPLLHPFHLQNLTLQRVIRFARLKIFVKWPRKHLKRINRWNIARKLLCSFRIRLKTANITNMFQPLRQSAKTHFIFYSVRQHACVSAPVRTALLVLIGCHPVHIALLPAPIACHPVRIALLPVRIA